MKNSLFMFVLAALTLSACQTVYVPKAREVKKKPNANGVIALPAEYRPEDRQKADELMKQNCGSGFNVTDEGEVVVGQKTSGTNSSTNRDDSRSTGTLFGIPMVTGANAGVDQRNESTVTSLKEWQIVYDCGTPGADKKVKR
jgi:hypothetical protein